MVVLLVPLIFFGSLFYKIYYIMDRTKLALLTSIGIAVIVIVVVMNMNRSSGNGRGKGSGSGNHS